MRLAEAEVLEHYPGGGWYCVTRWCLRDPAMCANVAAMMKAPPASCAAQASADASTCAHAVDASRRNQFLTSDCIAVP